MKKILTKKDDESVTVFIPERSDIENLMVGDVAPNVFGHAEVTRIAYVGEDLKGRKYVGYYTKLSENSQISASMKEGELIRSLHVCKLFTSHELDIIERNN